MFNVYVVNAAEPGTTIARYVMPPRVDRPRFEYARAVVADALAEGKITAAGCYYVAMPDGAYLNILPVVVEETKTLVVAA